LPKSSSTLVRAVPDDVFGKHTARFLVRSGLRSGVRSSARMPSMASQQELSCLAHTDAGIVAVWSPAGFAPISDYDSWEAALLDDDDIIEHIACGSLVPICIGADGAWRLIVRWAVPTHRAELTDRERRYVMVTSEPYLFVSDGVAVVCGYEKIDNDPGHELPRLHIPPGRYAVTIHLVDWEAEAGACDEDGHASAEVLADFIVLLNPEPEPAPDYRSKVQSFERPN
jgi:hypothetical protein